MSFLDAVTQGRGGLIVGLAMMLLITGLVARTSRRVLGIQVSITRALLVSLILSVVLGRRVANSGDPATAATTHSSDAPAAIRRHRARRCPAP